MKHEGRLSAIPAGVVVVGGITAAERVAPRTRPVIMTVVRSMGMAVVIMTVVMPLVITVARAVGPVTVADISRRGHGRRAREERSREHQYRRAHERAESRVNKPHEAPRRLNGRNRME